MITHRPQIADAKNKQSATGYILPFAVFLVFLGTRIYLPFGLEAEYSLRITVVTVVLLAFSRRLVSFRTSNSLGSLALGISVYAIWVAPDILWPSYREHWLFSNPLLGNARSSLPKNIQPDLVFLIIRFAGSALLVPVIEELFWRGWLMRYLISTDFIRVQIGSYAAWSFWITAVLFASEHGPYWDVGLVAGIMYNWWMIRTRSLADCILAHAVTNGCLGVHVIYAGQWQYWL